MAVGTWCAVGVDAGSIYSSIFFAIDERFSLAKLGLVRSGDIFTANFSKLCVFLSRVNNSEIYIYIYS